MLGFFPEPIESLKARFNKALERVWDAREYMTQRPGMYRDYVFDFEDGMRLLISRSTFPDIGTHIHISASFAYQDKGPHSFRELCDRVKAGYDQLGGSGLILFIGRDLSGVPHWIVKDES